MGSPVTNGQSEIVTKRAGEEVIPAETFKYEGERIVPGTHAHWKLMERACWAKFTQNDDARSALLATGARPLTHVMRRDSTTIPGAIVSEIWMRIRKRLAEGRSLPLPEGARWGAGEPSHQGEGR